MRWIIETLQRYPEIAIFLTLAILFAISGIKLGAIQEEAKSKVPALGYTITYTVGNTLLILLGAVIVLMMK